MNDQKLGDKLRERVLFAEVSLSAEEIELNRRYTNSEVQSYRDGVLHFHRSIDMIVERSLADASMGRAEFVWHLPSEFATNYAKLDGFERVLIEFCSDNGITYDIRNNEKGNPQVLLSW